MLKFITQYTKFVPYFYFISIVAYWFTDINKTEGITAYPILLLGIPFLWQIIKPNKSLNFILGITFVCVSSYLILAYLFSILNMITLSTSIKVFLVYGGIFILLNFVMALWIIRNSIHRTF
ncbi:MAG: hypothetical protein GW839_01745 [Flavobacteriales bacterium]|nr:hypothetical protein [Flavobacteriia bacterium]NCP05413.1 hypothetical protein [Flavobacteriales bacterium]PIV94952.1 MAG: hypothetical protein COW44_01600 [Flavobacteriaceae bacterium CG17_big_fil_post_rev_8_21_14_2_50_33_15]PIY11392.1 MAG: hypothetical protein COZ17_06850 [Flavobacteriaceae bacterium CG_4_10_14_3_um_filter_33_47]PJB19193.1 MAG: hypothetical protein CO117_05620 [Flavobacteriaceae bacterium CG_4_9_14_3_um_filter_33_16]